MFCSEVVHFQILSDFKVKIFELKKNGDFYGLGLFEI
jgi:hypothetical protein